MTDTPIATGIYPGLPFSQYLAIDAVSNTSLGLMERSPAHYKAKIELERTKPLVLGQLVHAGRLEPLALAERYAVMPEYQMDAENLTTDGKRSESKTTRYYKEKANEFLHANGDKECITREAYWRMQQIVTGLIANEETDRLLNSPGQVELTLVWIDPATGLLCKARLDKHVPRAQAFVDLKSCAELEAFPRSLARYGYHRQMAHYQAGWAVLNGGELLEPWIVAVESERPYCSMAAPLDEETLERGRERRDKALDRIADCMQSNHWPGPPSPTAWRVPEWELNSGDPVELIVGGESVEV